MIDEIAFVVFIGCIVAYRVLFKYRCRHPDACRHTVIEELYKTWVDDRVKEENPITAVQALRNMLMACSIFITSILILLGFLLGGLAQQLGDTTPFMGIDIVSAGEVRATTIAISIIFCVLCFVMAARLATRLTLIITSKPAAIDLGGGMSGMNVARKTFLSMQNNWMLGIRSLFYMVGVLGWLVSAFIFMIVTVCVTVYLVWFQDVWSIK